MKVGILALQGAFREHAEAFDAIGADAVLVRTPEQLAGVDALAIPGGESTTIDKLLDSSGLREPVATLVRDGMPALATCAGLIVLAREVTGDALAGTGGSRSGTPDLVTEASGAASAASATRRLALLDVTVRRNGYGRQVDSFEAALAVKGLPGGPFEGVFIRAPVIETVGAEVETLAEHDGKPVLVRQGAIWAATFHPELSGDLRIHQRFVES
ncbi:MAG TPA: pyridoxal 5'-phosphate synthase glutaminase subunit PdxT [Acidimicrobiia bacterium]|nr:pyridoxal 5'-phosphate synthase glutaminase subunit PdxT [Acidimicrobiia bacterium]